MRSNAAAHGGAAYTGEYDYCAGLFYEFGCLMQNAIYLHKGLITISLSTLYWVGF